MNSSLKAKGKRKKMSSSNQPKKNQHQVPKSYLRRFTDDGNHLYAFDKQKLRSFRSHVDKIACQRHFYDLTSKHIKEKIDPQYIENEALQDIDCKLGKLIEDIIGKADKRIPLEINEKNDFSQHVVFQMLRTQATREFIKQYEEEEFTEKYRKCPEYKGQNITVKLNKEFIAVKHIKIMFDPDLMTKAATIILNSIWIIGINRTSNLFYTSDNPVVIKRHVDFPGLMIVALDDPSMETAYPLSPKHILLIRERSHFIESAHLDCKSLDFNVPGNIDNYNELQVSQSHRQVYSRKNEFSTALNICKKFPQFRDLSRKLIN
jgi:hypothetical protein